MWTRRILLAVAGVLAGLVAATAMVLAMAAGRTWLGVSPPPEAVPDRLAPLLSIETFFDLFARYGGYNGLKKFGVQTGLQALFATGALVGLAYSLISESGPARRARTLRWGISRYGVVFIAIAVLAVWTAFLVILWPVLSANYRGFPPNQARLITASALFFYFSLFGSLLALVYHFIARPVAVRRETPPAAAAVPVVAMDATETIRRPVGRRAVVAAIAGAILALPSYALIRRLYDRATFSYDGRPYSGPGVQPITPTDQFYSVTKNVVDPNVSTDFWGLEITGLVNHPRRIDFAELMARQPSDQETTLMCISNRIGSGLFSNAVWTGVPMRELLDEAGVRDGAVEVFLRGADGYTDTFSIEKAMDPTTMVVYRMNGDPLPERHGFPARVIVPGLYGEKNVKWVTGIEVIDHDGKGFYEQQGWGPDFVIPTRSDIFAPRWRRGGGRDAFSEPFALGQRVTIKGRAFAGNRGISSVEASVDGGETWRPVRIDYPGTSLTWTFWSLDWAPQVPGETVILSRAVDGHGDPQPAETQGIVPQGARGYHRVVANVV